MDPSTHALGDLFRQLGLPGTPQEINRFIARHRPLPAGVLLAEAGFWSTAQAAFLREESASDADWTELIDRLDASLRG